jgi:adapter protein MecA 1/2
MRIEKINNNQIKCVLDKEELLSRHINVSELAYGSDKAQELFKDMMQKASYEFGFESGAAPLMIEAVPLSSEGIMLIITKVDNPDELDEKYNGLSIPSAKTFKKKEEEITHDSHLDEVLSEDHIEEPVVDEERISAFFVYGFNGIDDISHAVKTIHDYPFNKSRVYKTDSSNKYLLSIEAEAIVKADCKVVRGLLSEYGEAVHCRKNKLNYFDEHYEVVVKEDAIDKLCRL